MISPMKDKKIIEKVAYFLATGFYSGLAKKGPGTCGSVVAALSYVLLSNLLPQSVHGEAMLLIAVFLTALSIVLSNFLLSRSSDDKKDPQEIVIDEFAGFFVSTVGIQYSLTNALLCFVLFRFFDISKLPPIKRVEKLPRGYGITLDDVLAGVYANLLAHLIINLCY